MFEQICGGDFKKKWRMLRERERERNFTMTYGIEKRLKTIFPINWLPAPLSNFFKTKFK